MSAQKDFKGFIAQQKAKKESLSESPLEKLISDLKYNPSKFLSEYKNALPKILSMEKPELKNMQEENLITVFIDASETYPEIKNIYNEFMKLVSKGFFTVNRNKETFLFELCRRNNIKLFLETILNLENLKLLSDELLSVENINSENCFTYIIKGIKTIDNKNHVMKKACDDLLKKVFKLILENYKILDNFKPLDKFNVFNYYTTISIAERSLNNLSKEDILKDFDIIFSNKDNFDICKIILYEEQVKFNFLTSLTENEKFFDLIDIFIQKYSQNKFCNYPELIFDFTINLVNFQNHKNIMYFLPKLIPILIGETYFEKNIGIKNVPNIYHCLFSNLKIKTDEKNLLFKYINEYLLKNKDDFIIKLLSQENKEGYLPFIVYLLNNILTKEDEKFFIENILIKTGINEKKINNLKYQNWLLNLLSKDKIRNFELLFEFLEKNKLINLFAIEKDRTCFLNKIISMNMTNDLIIAKFVIFIINNFDQVDSFEHLKYLIKFLIKYLSNIKIEELKKIIKLMRDKFINDIKKEEGEFIQKIKKIKIECKIIDKSLFSFKTKYNDFFKSLSDIITEIWFNREYELNSTKDLLITMLDLIGIYNYKEIILFICSSNEKFKPEIVDIFIEKYYSKFNLEQDKYLQYFSLFNFQNSFCDNNKLKNKNFIYFYLRFIQGISNTNTKIFYQNMIYSILNKYKFESDLPLFFVEKELNELNEINNKNKDLFIQTKLLNDEIKLTLFFSILDYKNIFNTFYTQYISKLDSSNIYSVINKLNGGGNLKQINFEINFDENKENIEKYKFVCNLLNEHFIVKFYLFYFNSLVKKGKCFKFQNICMKEISKLLKDENEFIEIANYQLARFIEYHELIKEKKINIGIENDEIKNENNIFGLNILFLLFKKSIEKIFIDNEKNLEGKDNIWEDIAHFKIEYLKEFNIISNDEEEKIFIGEGIGYFKKKYLNDELNLNQNEQNEENTEHNLDFIKNNYNIEKYLLQFYNFNSDYFKKIPCENYKNLFEIFRNITEKIKKTKFIELLFGNKNELLKNIFDKIDFENIAKSIIKEEQFSKIKEKVIKLKEIKEINFENFFGCLSKLYSCIIEVY